MRPLFCFALSGLRFAIGDGDALRGALLLAHYADGYNTALCRSVFFIRLTDRPRPEPGARPPVYTFSLPTAQADLPFLFPGRNCAPEGSLRL